FCLVVARRPLSSSLFPYTTLFRSEVFSNSSAVCQTEIPFIQRFASAGTYSHADGQPDTAFLPFQFQIQISGPLISSIVFLQKITAHLSVSGPEGIQTFRTHIPVQEQRDHTLHSH